MNPSSSARRFTAVHRKLLLAGGLLLALSGCATMTPEECLTADWREQGLRDGMNGQTRAYVEKHREACSKVGVAPDSALWEEGRKEGLLYYCTPENGLNTGRAGRTYRQVCPPELERGFLERYRAGYKVYEAEKRLDQLISEQRSKQSSLDREKDDKKRDSLRRQLRDLDYRLRGARDDLHYAERQLYR